MFFKALAATSWFWACAEREPIVRKFGHAPANDPSGGSLTAQMGER